MKVYLVWELYPTFDNMNNLTCIFSDLQQANDFTDKKMKETYKDRVYDSYGIIEGVEYKVETMEVL